MTYYYDLILGLIPLSLLGVGGLLVAAGVPLPVATVVGGAAAISLMGHAMFVRAPTQPTAATAATAGARAGVDRAIEEATEHIESATDRVERTAEPSVAGEPSVASEPSVVGEPPLGEVSVAENGETGAPDAD